MHLRTSSFTALPLAAFLVLAAGCGSDDKNPTGPVGNTGDTTAPTVTSTNPGNGATGVAVITASFSEAMNASTITTSTFTLEGPWRNARGRDRHLQRVAHRCEIHTHECPHGQHDLFSDDHDRGQGRRRQCTGEQSCVELHDVGDHNQSGVSGSRRSWSVRRSGRFDGHQHRLNRSDRRFWRQPGHRGDWLPARNHDWFDARW